MPEVGLTTFRMPYTPVTFGALAGTVARRSVRSGAQDADPRLGRGSRARCSRTSACGSAPAISRARGEDMHAAVARECMAVRDARRHLRRLDARQDRGRRPGRGRVHEPALHQRLDEARAGPLPLRPDAERGRLRHGRRRRRPPRAPTASMSPPRPAARRASSTTWRTISRPSSPISRSG